MRFRHSGETNSPNFVTALVGRRAKRSVSSPLAECARTSYTGCDGTPGLCDNLPMPRPDSLVVAAVLTALVAFGPISTDLYLPSLPSLPGAFGTSLATVQLTLSVFLIGFAVGMAAYGPLSDRFGRRPLILAGIAVYAVASVACALAPSIEALIGFRLIQAIGASSGPVLARAVVRDVYGRDRAARVLAYMTLAMALAPAIGPILGGQIAAWFGWRANFWLLSGFGALILIAALTLIEETNRAKDPTALQAEQWLRNQGVLLRHRAFIGEVLTVAASYSGIFAFISGSSFVMIDILHLTPQRYGASFGIVVIGYMIGTFATGRLTLRLGPDRLVRAGTLLSACGGSVMLALALAAPPSVAAVIGPFFVFMVGAGLTLPNAIAGALGPFPTMAGLASSLLGFVQMTVAAGVGVLVGQVADGTARPMAAAVCLCALAATLAYRALAVRSTSAGRSAAGRPDGHRAVSVRHPAVSVRPKRATPQQRRTVLPPQKGGPEQGDANTKEPTAAP